MSILHPVTPRRRRSPALLVGLLGCSLALAGCAGQGASPSGPTASPSPETTVTVTATPSAEGTTPATPSCTGVRGIDAVHRWIAEVPPHPLRPEGGVNGWGVGPEFDDYLDTHGFETCAALSAIAIPTAGGTGSSPYAIMLFHDATYVQTATEQPIGFEPKIERLADDRIQVTYIYPLAGETTAGASGRAVSIFTWNEATHSVTREGDLPPDYPGSK